MADVGEEILLQANLFLLVLKRRHRQLQTRRKHRLWVTLLVDGDLSAVSAGDFDLRFGLDGLCAICGLSHSRF